MSIKDISALEQKADRVVDHVRETLWTSFKDEFKELDGKKPTNVLRDTPDSPQREVWKYFLDYFLQSMDGLHFVEDGFTSVRSKDFMKNFEAEYGKNSSGYPYVTGSTYFEHISELLDLNDSDVCAVLPYVLSAYSCHAGKSKGRFTGSLISTCLGYADNADNPPEENNSRRKKQIGKVSESFSFKGFTADLDSMEKEYARHPVKGLHPSMMRWDKIADGFHDVRFVNYIFMKWAYTILALREKAEPEKYHLSEEAESLLEKIRSDVQLVDCYLMYLKHTGQEIPEDLQAILDGENPEPRSMEWVCDRVTWDSMVTVM